MCPRCGGAVALHEGRPFVNVAGSVELWHRDCFEDRDALITRSDPLDFLPTPPTPRLVRILSTAVGGSLLVAIMVGQWTWGEMAPPPAAMVANVDPGPVTEPVVIRHEAAAHERLPLRGVTVETELESRYAVPVRGEIGRAHV